jgi:hypothetical protein
LTKAVLYQDEQIDAKRKAEISCLRAERWELFNVMHEKRDLRGVYLYRSPEAEQALKHRLAEQWRRLQEINDRLLVLTGNPIYDTSQ